MKYFLITAFGEDRPGIVKEVTQVLYKHGFNIEDSTMTRLNNEFTIMLVVQTDEKISEKDLKDEFEDIKEKLDLNIYIKEIPKTVLQKEHPSKELINLVVYGADKPGIVYNVAKLLSDKNINISDLRTEKSGELYVMIIEAELPHGIDIVKLEEDLNKLKEDMNIDITCEKIETAEM